MKLVALATRYKYTCYWCKKKFELEDLSRDHIIPTNESRRNSNKGGKCVLACIFCNQKRGNLSMESYRNVLMMEKRQKQLFQDYPPEFFIKPSRVKR